MNETSIIIPLVILFGVICLAGVYALGIFENNPDKGVDFDPVIKEQTVQVIKKYFPPTVIQEQNVYYGSGAARGMVFEVPRTMPARYLVVFLLQGYGEEFSKISIDSQELYNKITKSSAKIAFVEGKKKKKISKIKAIYVDAGEGKIMINPQEQIFT